MKSIILLVFAHVATITAAPFQEASESILRTEYGQKPDGEYRHGYHTKIVPEEEKGQLKEAVEEDDRPRNVIAVRGSYSFRKDDGSYETVNYYADETGFHADRVSIPKNSPRR